MVDGRERERERERERARERERERERERAGVDFKQTHPLSFLAAILKMMAGLEVVSTWAEASWLCETTQELPGPQ